MGDTRRDARAVSPDIVQLVVGARKKHPTWGPRKLLVVLSRHQAPVAKYLGSATLGWCRVRFIAAMLEAEESFSELCERFEISRKQERVDRRSSKRALR